MSLNAKQLTSLRFLADAITATPGDIDRVQTFARRLDLDDAVQTALKRVENGLKKAISHDPKKNLLQTAITLLNEKDDLSQDAGAAIFSSILNRQWDVLREADGDSAAPKSELLEQYLAAAKNFRGSSRR